MWEVYRNGKRGKIPGMRRQVICSIRGHSGIREVSRNSKRGKKVFKGFCFSCLYVATWLWFTIGILHRHWPLVGGDSEIYDQDFSSFCQICQFSQSSSESLLVFQFGNFIKFETNFITPVYIFCQKFKIRFPDLAIQCISQVENNCHPFCSC